MQDANVWNNAQTRTTVEQFVYNYENIIFTLQKKYINSPQ